MHTRLVVAVCAGTLAIASCTTTSTYEERMQYLRKVANQGAETHQLLKSQDATVDAERCKGAYGGLQTINDRPRDTQSGGFSPAWNAQIEQFFVDSCVSGKPKPVPGDDVSSAPPTSSSTLSSTPATSASG